jgi:nucleotide-binding universal stress UspA family protein
MTDARGWTWPPRTILVAVDFGPASARALSIAGALATAFGARIRALHAERFEPPPYFTLEQIVRLEADRRAAQALAVDHLATFARDAGAGAVEAVIRDEGPVDAILEEAATADLVVMGTHGRRGPGRWWLGSVAERVARSAVVPVLVTRTGEDPVRELFTRVAFVGEGDGAPQARGCADVLARVAGGVVVDGGSVSACATDTMQRASLIVVARTAERPWAVLSDPSARVLTSCSAPVLFVPGRACPQSGREVEAVDVG